MKTNTKSPGFNSIALVAFALVGFVMILFFLLTEVQEPVYLIYFAPILGLLFYGSYYIINHKLDTEFFNRAYNED